MLRIFEKKRCAVCGREFRIGEDLLADGTPVCGKCLDSLPDFLRDKSLELLPENFKQFEAYRELDRNWKAEFKRGRSGGKYFKGDDEHKLLYVTDSAGTRHFFKASLLKSASFRLEADTAKGSYLDDVRGTLYFDADLSFPEITMTFPVSTYMDVSEEFKSQGYADGSRNRDIVEENQMLNEFLAVPYEMLEKELSSAVKLFRVPRDKCTPEFLRRRKDRMLDRWGSDTNKKYRILLAYVLLGGAENNAACRKVLLDVLQKYDFQDYMTPSAAPAEEDSPHGEAIRKWIRSDQDHLRTLYQNYFLPMPEFEEFTECVHRRAVKAADTAGEADDLKTLVTASAIAEAVHRFEELF